MSIKNSFRRAINRALNPLGFELCRIPFSENDPQPLSKVMIERMVELSVQSQRIMVQYSMISNGTGYRTNSSRQRHND